MSAVVFAAVLLLQQNLAFLSQPGPAPSFLRPAQPEREVRLARLEHLASRPLEKQPTVEPAIVVTKP